MTVIECVMKGCESYKPALPILPDWFASKFGLQDSSRWSPCFRTKILPINQVCMSGFSLGLKSVVLYACIYTPW